MLLVYKALHGLEPECLAEDCQLVPTIGHRHLHSSHGENQKNQEQVLAIAHSLQLDLEHGTVRQPGCESQILHSDNLDEHTKQILLVT